MTLDQELNRSHTHGREGLISKKGSRPVYVIPTDEELLIARNMRCVLKERQHS
jgi:acetate kinase